MRSLTNRLALLFAAITVAVLLVVYLYVVPPLQSSLRDQQLNNLAGAAERYSGPISQAVDRGLTSREIADLVPDLPDDVVKEVVRAPPAEEREQLRAAMSFPEGTVGAPMDFEMVSVREDVTLETVTRYLRRMDELPANTDQLFVVDHAPVRGRRRAPPRPRPRVRPEDGPDAPIVGPELATTAGHAKPPVHQLPSEGSLARRQALAP